MFPAKFAAVGETRHPRFGLLDSFRVVACSSWGFAYTHRASFFVSRRFAPNRQD